jgi:hypothetical protein
MQECHHVLQEKERDALAEPLRKSQPMTPAASAQASKPAAPTTTAAAPAQPVCSDAASDCLMIGFHVHCIALPHHLRGLRVDGASAQQVRRHTPIPAPGQQQPSKQQPVAARAVAAAVAAKPAAAPARQALAPAKVHAPVEKRQPAERGAKPSTPKAAVVKANDSLAANSAEVHPVDGKYLRSMHCASACDGPTQPLCSVLVAWSLSAVVCLPAH